MTKTFSTAEFEFAHGRKPRGRGVWVFRNLRTKEIIVVPLATLTEAKASLAPGRYVICS